MVFGQLDGPHRLVELGECFVRLAMRRVLGEGGPEPVYGVPRFTLTQEEKAQLVP